MVKEGQTINGKYQIIEKIGEGATSHVYLAYDLVAERNVSLKVLKEDNLTEKKIKNFKKEAHAISLLNHENIIKIYEINEYEHTYFIAQEYIEGMSLKEYIENTDIISPKKAVEIIIKVLEGLSHAHEKRVIHKDIKSQNILLGINQEIKITDFGIADVLEDDMTKTQSLMGTPQYVAPEVLNKGYSTHQTDIYSTGILLYELLIGHAPFYGEKPTVIILKQLNQPIPSVKQQRDEIPQSLENILVKSTAKKLTNRYQDANSMIEDLKSCFNVARIDEEPLEIKNDFEFQNMGSVNLSKIKEEEKLQKKEKSRRNNLTTVIVVILIFLTLVVFINLVVFFNSSSQRMPDIIGENYEVAINTLKTLKIDESDIEIIREESRDVEKDSVISTVPSPGDVVEEDKIILTVSNGIDPFKIENYVGKYKEEAQKEIETAGLQVKFFYDTSEKEKGTVISQSPAQGEEVLPGDTVYVQISNGLNTVKLDEFVGKTEEEFDEYVAKNKLRSAKTYVCSDTVKESYIISQSPKSGEEVEESSEFSIEVSNGACNKEKEAVEIGTKEI